MFFECVHGFPRPVEVLRHARAALRPGGAVLVVEERAAEEFTAPGDETERSSRPPARSGACRRAGPAPPLSPSARSSARRTCATWPSGPATTACRSCRSSTRRGGSTASCHDHRRRDRGPRRAGDRHVLRAGPGASPGCWTGRRPPGAGLAPARGGSGPGRAAARCLPGRLRRAARSRSRGAGQRAVERFGQIDILVNNAGVAYSGPPPCHWPIPARRPAAGIFLRNDDTPGTRGKTAARPRR